MKVLHLDTGGEWRGGQQQLLHLAEHMPESVVLLPHGPLLDRLRERGVSTLRWAGALRGVWQLRRLIVATGADLVAAHTSQAHQAAWLAGAKVVVHRRVDFVPHRRSAWKYRYPIGFVAVSGAVGRVLQCSGVPEERIAIVPDGVVLPRVNRAATSGAVRLLAVGALVPHKGHEDLVRAMSLLPESFHLRVAGDGPERTSLERLARSLGVEHRIRWLGWCSDLTGEWAQATLVVHPSREEGLGQSVVEAMGAGVPVVATCAGGLAELIDDRTGWSVPPRDPSSLALAIRRAIEEPTEAFARAQNAQERAVTYSVNRMVEGTLRAYRRFLSRPIRSDGQPVY